MSTARAEHYLKQFPEIYRELGVADSVDLSRFDNVLDLLDHAFKRYPDHAACTSLGHTLSYAELDQLSAAFAAYLQQETGLQPGDRVAVQMPNLIQYPVVTIGILRAGMVVVNTNPLYSARELEHQFNDGGVKALVVQANVAKTVAEVLPRTGVKHVILTELADLHPTFKRYLINWGAKYLKRIVPAVAIPGVVSLREALAKGRGKSYQRAKSASGDVAMLQYTGGTTGVAKGTMLSHGNLVANALQIEVLFATHGLPTDASLTLAQPLPVYHIYAFMTCIYSMLQGWHVVLFPNPRDLPAVVKTLQSYPPDFFCGLNTLFMALCNNAEFRALDFSRLKVTLSGGMALSHQAAADWQRLTGVEIAEGYGLTETSPVVSSNPGNRKIIGTIGVPLPGTDVRIVNDDGEDLPLGEPGELWVAGPQVMLGYWQRPDETEKVMHGDWFATGDIAVLREDGYLQIVDRKKDMIIVSGFNVYPNEIEDVLYGHPDVLECAAISVPDAETGEAVKVFVVSRSGKLTEAEVRDFCRKDLTGYKVPKQVEFRQELPKTAVGKILRRELRDS